MRVINLTPEWPPDKQIKVLDISDSPELIKLEMDRTGNRPVSEYPAPGWYDIAELKAAGLYRGGNSSVQ